MKIADVVARYPALYGHLPFGIECGDGWAWLLDSLSGVLSQLGGVRVLQVKEKFGELRFYVEVERDSAALGAIWMAERLSWHTCEACGATGRKRGCAWLRTLCDNCEAAKP